MRVPTNDQENKGIETMKVGAKKLDSVGSHLIEKTAGIDERVRPELSKLLKDAFKAFGESTDPVELVVNLLLLLFVKMPADKLRNHLNSPVGMQPNVQHSLSEIVGLLDNKLQTLKGTFDKVKKFPESPAATQLKEKVGALNTFAHNLRDTYGSKVEELNAVADKTNALEKEMSAANTSSNINTAKNEPLPP